jgi:hypothetical protein
MNRIEMIEEIEDFQDLITDMLKVISNYVDKEADMDTELEPAFEDLQIAASNMNDQLENFTSTM